MTTFLTRVDAVPLKDEDFSSAFSQWLSVMVDSLNEVLQIIENVNFISESVSATLLSATINNAYLIANAALTTISLPDSAAVGGVVRIIGLGAGGWVLTPGSGQTIKVAGSSAGTSVASTSQYDCIHVVCVEENTTWVTLSSETSGFTIT